MARATRRRPPRLECLEARELLTGGGPTADEAAMLWRVNASRANPPAAIDWALSDPGIQGTLDHYGVNTTQVRQDFQNIKPRPPLAWNDALGRAAQFQSDYQASIGKQTHEGPDAATIDGQVVPMRSQNQRLDAFHYTDRANAAENAFAYSQDADHAMRAFLIDWGVQSLGHRTNLLQPDAKQPSYKETGIGMTDTSNNGLGPTVISEDFGLRNNSPAYLLGFAYTQDAEGTYKAGEGRGNVEIEAENLATHQKSDVLTWDNSGGYQMALAPGSYKVTARINGQVVHSQRVTIDADNVEVDFRLNDPWDAPEAAAAPAFAQVIQSPVTQPPISTPPPAPARPAAVVAPPAPTSPPRQASGSGLAEDVILGVVLDSMEVFSFKNTSFSGSAVSLSSVQVFRG